MTEISNKLKTLACYLLGLAKKRGETIDVNTKNGLEKLNHLIYISYGYSLALKNEKLFDDPIYAESSGPITIYTDQVNGLIPCIEITIQEMQSFNLDENKYVDYLLEPFQDLVKEGESIDAFFERVQKGEMKLNNDDNKIFNLRHELHFFHLLLKVKSGELKKFLEPIEWHFNTPNHPFEKHLEQLYSKH